MAAVSRGPGAAAAKLRCAFGDLHSKGWLSWTVPQHQTFANGPRAHAETFRSVRETRGRDTDRRGGRVLQTPPAGSVRARRLSSIVGRITSPRSTEYRTTPLSEYSVHLPRAPFPPRKRRRRNRLRDGLTQIAAARWGLRNLGNVLHERRPSGNPFLPALCSRRCYFRAVCMGRCASRKRAGSGPLAQPVVRGAGRDCPQGKCRNSWRARQRVSSLRSGVQWLEAAPVSMLRAKWRLSPQHALFTCFLFPHSDENAGVVDDPPSSSVGLL